MQLSRQKNALVLSQFLNPSEDIGNLQITCRLFLRLIASVRRITIMKIIKYIFISFGILFVLTLIFLYFAVGKVVNTYEPVLTSEKIILESDTIYMYNKAWGVTWDHNLTWITTRNPSINPDSLNDYIYKANVLFYSFNNDTLTVYIRAKSNIPEHFDTNIQIVQIELSNPEMMDFYNKYYQGGKLIKINTENTPNKAM
jgi:hypothetical protein